MVFKCTCCDKPVREKPRLIGGFRELCYNDFEWLEPGKSVPALDERVRTRSESIPAVGERRLLKVFAPFNQEPGDRFNTLFMPELSALNGWEEYPGEISKSAVAACRFERVVQADEYRAWIEVSVERVTFLESLCERYPCVETDDVVGYGFELKLDFAYKHWEFYSFSAQGDLGEWRLVRVDGGRRHIVLIGEYGMHRDFICCGNVVIK